MISTIHTWILSSETCFLGVNKSYYLHRLGDSAILLLLLLLLLLSRNLFFH